MSLHLGSPSRILGPFTGVAFALLLASACGGRSDTEDYLFGAANGNGGFSASGGSSNASGARTGNGAARAAGGDGGPASGGTGVSRGGAATGGFASAGTSSVGGMAVGGMAAGGFGSGGSPTIPTLACGLALCNAATEFCCAGLGGYACVGAGSECNGAVLACTSSSDCETNAVCCLTLTDPVGSASYCQASCGDNGQRRERQLCRTDDECQRGRRCSETVFGVSVCARGNGR